MEKQEIGNKLNDLLMLEYDAVHAYVTCIKNVDDDDIQNNLTEFLSDHNRHVGRITEQVRQCGLEPKARPDFKGPFLKGLTGIMSKMGDKNALRVMHQNENLTNSAYDKALEEDFPQDICDILRACQRDERRHRAWIEQKLESLKAREEAKEIPPEERPITHYRLLSVPLFEDNREVIRNAADRQMTFVQQQALGEHLELSQQILNELGAARAVLGASGVPATLCRIGSIFWIAWYAAEPPRAAEAIDPRAAERHARVFHHLLEHGVALAPSAFEVGFLSLALCRVCRSQCQSVTIPSASAGSGRMPCR
jgi:rubrerythrin